MRFQCLAGLDRKGVLLIKTIVKIMKTFLSLPKNEKFFSYYAGLVPTLFKVGFIAQVISAATEITIIYALIYNSLQDFAPGQARALSIVGAVIGTALLEVGLRKFTPYSIRAILYGKFSGLDLVMSIFIFLATIGLLGASGYLSFTNSKEIVRAVAPAPDLQTDDQVKDEYNLHLANVNSQYSSDSAAIAGRYADQVTAKEKKFAALIAIEQAEYKKYLHREWSTGKSYRSKKEAAQVNVKRLEAEQMEAIAALKSQEANELKTLLQSKAGQLAGIKSELDANKSEIKTANNEAIASSKRMISTYGGGLAWFTVFCLMIFVVSVLLNEVHRKGSEIEEKAQPTQYDFLPGIFTELVSMVNNKYQYYARKGIYQLDGKTPEAPLPNTGHDLYDLAEIEQRKITLTREQLEAIQEQQQNRRRIGFKIPNNNSTSVNNATVSNSSNGQSSHNCDNCGNEYQAKVSWQRFCSPDCKTEFHAKQHGGQKFNARKYHQKKK